MIEKVPESVARAAKGATVWMKANTFVGIAAGVLLVAGGLVWLPMTLTSATRFFGIPAYVIPMIVLAAGAFIIYTYRILWKAANYLDESHTSLPALVGAITHLDRFFTLLTAFEAVRFAIPVISLFTTPIGGVGAVALKRSNAANMMRILAILNVLNTLMTGKPLGSVITLILLAPMIFFLWRAASFREKIEGEINETNADYVVGYLTNLRWYFMFGLILSIFVVVGGLLLVGLVVYLMNRP